MNNGGWLLVEQNNVINQILDISKNISKSIDKNKDDRGFLSQNILNELRNLVEHTALYVYNIDKNKQLDNKYENLLLGINHISGKWQYNNLKKFHNFLKKSVSHFTPNEGNSERLMLKYLTYLTKLRDFCKQYCNIKILENLNEFPTNVDRLSLQYYECIVEKIEKTNVFHNTKTDKFYIQTIKPFLVNNKIYYEITFTIAKDNTSKFNKIVAFSKDCIFDNYSTRLTLYFTNITLSNLRIPIILITQWNIDIRPCEFANFCLIFDKNRIQFTRTRKHEEFMKFLTEKQITLLEIVRLNDEQYYEIKTRFNEDKFKHLFLCLDQARNIILKNQSGKNILSYILHTMNNKIIKNQTYKKQTNQQLTNLFLKNGCIPFEKMPFCSSLLKHNPKLVDLFECIDVANRKHKLLAKIVKNNSEINGYLYTKIENIEYFFKDNNINNLIEQHNKELYAKHKPDRDIEILHDKFLFINSYEKIIIEIMQRLSKFTKEGVKDYQTNINKWLECNQLDSEEKKDYLKNLLCNSKLALIYGAAGTGKTTLIEYISNFFADKNKLYLANTNTAVNNLKQRIQLEKSSFSTVASFKNTTEKYDIVIIDECSTISNRDIKEILNKVKCEILICVGDVYQIESIRFGNWFLLAQEFFKNIQLKHIYRTQEEKLQILWEKIRLLDDDILEAIVKNNSSKRIEDFDFKRKIDDDDEIILCLNYGGIYGVNNINRFLQENNPSPNELFYFNGLHYKVSDPVLFNEVSRFGNEIYNNLKGVITDIKETKTGLTFTVKVFKIIKNELDFEIVETGDNYTEIKFDVLNADSDNDDTEQNTVPFQVAYAISIHKAQGLEYDNISIIIADEIEEQITHNIFYTAVTRAKKDLKIYWSPETENKILKSLKIKNVKMDYNLLRNKIQKYL